MIQINPYQIGVEGNVDLMINEHEKFQPKTTFVLYKQEKEQRENLTELPEAVSDFTAHSTETLFVATSRKDTSKKYIYNSGLRLVVITQGCNRFRMVKTSDGITGRPIESHTKEVILQIDNVHSGRIKLFHDFLLNRKKCDLIVQMSINLYDQQTNMGLKPEEFVSLQHNGDLVIP